MRICPFSQPHRIKTGCLLSVGEQRERAPPCVGTGGHPSDPAMLSRSMGKVPVRWASEIEPAAGWGES